jgi:hypothetical protein
VPALSQHSRLTALREGLTFQASLALPFVAIGESTRGLRLVAWARVSRTERRFQHSTLPVLEGAEHRSESAACFH